MARASSQDVIVLGKRRRKRLERIVAAASSPQHLVLRAKIVLAAWRREANAKIARDLRVCVDTVRKWRRRFRREGMPGLFDRPRSGRPPVYGIEDQLLIVATVTERPGGGLALDPPVAGRAPGRAGGDQRLADRADPGLARRQTTPGPRLAQPARRPGVPHQSPGRVPALPGPARRGHRAVQRGREDRHAGPLPQTRHPPGPARPGRTPRVRVRPPRHRVADGRHERHHRHRPPEDHHPERLGHLHRVPHRARRHRRPGQEDPPDPGQRLLTHLPQDPQVAHGAPPVHRDLHPLPRQLAQHDRDLLLDPDPPTPSPRRLRLPRGPDPRRSPTSSTYNRTAKPFRWTYDAKLLRAA